MVKGEDLAPHLPVVHLGWVAWPWLVEAEKAVLQWVTVADLPCRLPVLPDPFAGNIVASISVVGDRTHPYLAHPTAPCLVAYLGPFAVAIVANLDTFWQCFYEQYTQKCLTKMASSLVSRYLFIRALLSKRTLLITISLTQVLDWG